MSSASCFDCCIFAGSGSNFPLETFRLSFLDSTYSVFVGLVSYDYLQARDFKIPAELLARLDAARAPASSYFFFVSAIQTMIADAHPVDDKPEGYMQRTLVSGESTGIGGPAFK